MWALDLGTTNTLLARWDRKQERPSVLELRSISRAPEREDPLEAPRVVPSAVDLVEHPSFWTRVGQWGPLARKVSWGKLAHIGRPAVERNQLHAHPSYVPTFKMALARSPFSSLARSGGRSYCARDVARIFLRELLAEAEASTGERIRELVVTVPVETFETYRAELSAIGKSLGLRRIRFIDEPVAATLGYGIGLAQRRRVLVVDFGGGTFHIALVRLSLDKARVGQADVVAKAGRDVGGNTVDSWLLDEFCRQLDYSLSGPDAEEGSLWRRILLAEACRVKEAAYFQEKATFELVPPEDLRRFEARLRGKARSLTLGRGDLQELLAAKGLYRMMEECLAEVLWHGAAQGVQETDIEDVIMVGGSTLLPDVYGLFERRFGRDRVRAWQPFEAVAYGATVFAAGRTEPADFIVHDYALLTYDLKTKEPQYTVIVPRGTRIPTPPKLWQRQMVPTCPLGAPETVFKLIVCELGINEDERRFAWDGEGRLHKLGGKDGPSAASLAVKLNEANPALGTLDPPHSPSDSAPRLEVSFCINAERWLCVTVVDLRRGKPLLRDEPVVRLL